MSLPYEKYTHLLSDQEKAQLDRLLDVYGKWPLELEEIWSLMDKVWNEMGCNNKRLNNEKIQKYYMHPVWLLNGLFIESHALSMMHRNNISDWIVEHNIKSMLDYGGGFCTLSRLTAEKNPDIAIDVLEPFPAEVSKKIIAQYPQIRFIGHLARTYDCMVALDVLEHVADPLQVLAKMIQATAFNGTLLIGNCFKPVINCHLPRTFYLNNSFRKIASMMNLDFKGKISGCHAEIYQKKKENSQNWLKIKMLEVIYKSKHNFRAATTKVVDALMKQR